MTLAPSRVAGTGSLTGPVQKPAGSGGGGGGTPAVAAPDPASARAETSRATIGLIQLSARRRTWHIKAMVERRVAAVLRNNLHLPFFVWDEPKRNDRVSAERNVRVQVKHLPAVIRRINGADESGWREVPRDLVHLHAVEVRMADHQLRLHWLARVEIT